MFGRKKITNKMVDEDIYQIIIHLTEKTEVRRFLMLTSLKKAKKIHQTITKELTHKISDQPIITITEENLNFHFSLPISNIGAIELVKMEGAPEIKDLVYSKNPTITVIRRNELNGST